MFENRLLAARKKRGLPQQQVADAAKIHVASYSAYENNKKTPPIDILLRIANALDVSLDWLCKNEKDLPAVNNYGDIARSIVSVMQKLGEKCTVQAMVDMDGDPYAKIMLWDGVIYSFFAKALKFEEMSKGSADERELYFAWLEKKLAELDKQPISFEEIDPDLPF